MRRTQQMPLEARVRFEVSVKKRDREVWRTETLGNDLYKRFAQLQAAGIAQAQFPGSKISFRRIPLDVQ